MSKGIASRHRLSFSNEAEARALVENCLISQAEASAVYVQIAAGDPEAP